MGVQNARYRVESQLQTDPRAQELMLPFAVANHRRHTPRSRINLLFARLLTSARRQRRARRRTALR